jgi:hypothetical protein
MTGAKSVRSKIRNVASVRNQNSVDENNYYSYNGKQSATIN